MKKCNRCGSKDILFWYVVHTKINGKHELKLCTRCTNWGLQHCVGESTEFFWFLKKKADKTLKELNANKQH